MLLKNIIEFLRSCSRDLTNYFQLATSTNRLRLIAGIIVDLLCAFLLALRPLLFMSIISPSEINLIHKMNFYYVFPAIMWFLFNEIFIVIFRFIVVLLLDKSANRNADAIRVNIISNELIHKENTSTAGELYSIITQQTDLLKQSLTNGLAPLLSSIALIISLLYINFDDRIIYLSVIAFCLASLCLNVTGTLIRARRISHWLRREEEKSETVQATILNRSWLALNDYYKEVIFNLKNRFLRASNAFFSVRIAEVMSTSFVEGLIVLVLVVSVLTSDFRNSNNIVLLLGVLLTAAGAMTNIGNSLNVFGDGLLAAKRINYLFLSENHTLIPTANVSFSIDPENSSVSVSRIFYHLDSKEIFLDPFVIFRNSIIWVKGPSGIGKTILLRLLARSLRKEGIKCCYFDHSSIFVEEEVHFSDLETSAYADNAGIKHLEFRKIETFLGNPFSLGERQRLHAIKFFSLKPEVVILDETFNGVPLKQQKDILLFIRDNYDCSIIVCSHVDLQSVADATIEPRVIYNNAAA